MRDLELPRIERGSGGDPGEPKDCGLGNLTNDPARGACNGKHYRTIGGVRLCRKHYDLVQAIARDAPKITRGRRPETMLMRRVAA